jgi:hypothetical protein
VPALLERARREAVGGVMDVATVELVQRLRAGAEAAAVTTPRSIAPRVPVFVGYPPVTDEVLIAYVRVAAAMASAFRSRTALLLLLNVSHAWW